jgi:hypothetical protein
MRFWKTAGALAVGLVLGASAVAVGEAPPNQYTACLTKDGLITRVALGEAPARACAKTETEINWNEQGPQGQQGATGEPGLQGEPGAKGDPGEPGGSLASLQGSACTVSGGHGHLSVSIDGAGAVNMTCKRMYTVTVTVDASLASLGSVLLRNGSGLPEETCTAASCSFEYPAGTVELYAILAYGAPYAYQCTDNYPIAPEEHGSWYGGCEWGVPSYPFDGNKQVAITPPPAP